MEDVAFVTEDRWMREAGGCLDATDHEVLREASVNGQFQVRVLTTRQMLEALRTADPERFQEFKKQMESQAGIPLTLSDLDDLARKATHRIKEFDAIVGTAMTLGQAAQVRHWRVDGHMTWRSVARAAYTEGWFGRNWEPVANQIMGMALCDRAAEMFRESYREAPWN